MPTLVPFMEQVDMEQWRLWHLRADLGFADAFNFSRLFKKVTGRSPHAFRSDHAAEAKR